MLESPMRIAPRAISDEALVCEISRSSLSSMFRRVPMLRAHDVDRKSTVTATKARASAWWERGGTFFALQIRQAVPRALRYVHLII